MGFLNRLFGSKPTFEDRVWLTRERALEDLVRQAVSCRNDDVVDCLVAYHFPDTGEKLRSHFENVQAGYQVLNRPGTEKLENLRAPVGSTIAMLGTDEIPEAVQRGREQGSRSSMSGKRACHVHLAEHFPVPYRDDHVLNLHTILPPKSEFFCYVGLDEPWFESALGGSTRALLEQLGMPEDEPLVHSMIGSALRRSQEQLAEQQRGLEQRAASSKEWLELNTAD